MLARAHLAQNRGAQHWRPWLRLIRATSGSAGARRAQAPGGCVVVELVFLIQLLSLLNMVVPVQCSLKTTTLIFFKIY